MTSWLTRKVPNTKPVAQLDSRKTQMMQIRQHDWSQCSRPYDHEELPCCDKVHQSYIRYSERRSTSAVPASHYCWCKYAKVWAIAMFLAATKQLYEWFSPSVRPSVCPSVRLSVCHTFLTMFPSSYHHKIFRSYYQWQKWRPCKRSRSEVKGQGHRGHNPT